MKPLRTSLQAAARQAHASQPVIEKDYVLSYLLAGLATTQVSGGWVERNERFSQISWSQATTAAKSRRCRQAKLP